MPDHPVYTADQGAVHFDQPTTVIIAGRPRDAIVYCDPRVEANWRGWDRMVYGDDQAQEGGGDG